MNKNLRAAYLMKEKAELFLANLEQLKAEGSISETENAVLKAEYTNMREDAIFKVNSAKALIKKELDSKAGELDIFRLKLSYLEARYKVGQIPAKTYLKQEKGPRSKAAQLERQLSELQALVNSTCSADISVPAGGKLPGLSLMYRKKQPPAPWRPFIPQMPVPQVSTAERLIPDSISITDLQIVPARVLQGNDLGIIVNVRNNGPNTVQYKIELKINGELKDSNQVTLASGNSQEITFVVTTDAAGEHEVAVDGLTGKFSVISPADTAHQTKKK